MTPSLSSLRTLSPLPGLPRELHLAKVTAVNDPERLNRVEIRLLSHSGAAQQEGTLWARVAVPCAGGNKGAFFIPDVDDEVVVSFINGDSRYPVVLGSLWNGNDPAPETLGGGGHAVDRWTLVGKAGTRIAIEEETPGEATIRFTTPGGTSGELTDAGGGKVVFSTAGTTVTINTRGVTVDTPLTVKVQATQVTVSAAQVQVDAPISKFSGVVQAETVITNSVISASYTPGAGNIW
ncbi:phage baseplate assembly protein V [Desulfatitalea alkaliphila]|uniref:Phage baseplate assembly protein V n=1 Tax=Desulfatitalea alkaliphila TaxID=2929485 RepID=A0AA41R391_9BACT|nr:phage baseplate assembly protein V [Desulfatitalea alkaliphila]MCJ8500105.1 phage baseplate assembly protein V [Desulfatitalea alkaliphila]